MEARHHQLDEVVTALQRHEIVVFVGARGTGKTYLTEQLREHYAGLGVDTLVMDLRDAGDLSDFNAPLATRLGCEYEYLTARGVAQDFRLRVIVDNLQDVFEKPWGGEFQDQWRAFFDEPSTAGRVSALLLGRPQARQLLGGEGSPLLGAAHPIEARPLNPDELAAQFTLSAGEARALHRKTGGHPRLSAEFARHLRSTDEDFAKAVRRFAEDQTQQICLLIDDFGVVGREILGELVDTQSAIPESTLLTGRLHGGLRAAMSVIDDLRGAGLIRAEANHRSELSASVLREIDAVRHYATAPEWIVPLDSPGRHADAAKRLYEIENLLRQKVLTYLNEVDQHWWPNRIPEDCAASAEELRRRDLESRGGVAHMHPIVYLSLGELVTVIQWESNWSMVFEPRLDISFDAFGAATREIIEVRNRVAHNRPVQDLDLAQLEAAAVRLGLTGFE